MKIMNTPSEKKNRAFDIGYQLIEAKLNQENCQWLSGENVGKMLRLELGLNIA